MKFYKLKKILVALFLLALCFYSAWLGMQTLSIVSLILFLGSLYSKKVNILFDLVISFARNAKQAKFGNLELNIGDSFKQAVLVNSDKDWVRTIVSDLTPTHLTILLAINMEVEYHFNPHIKNTLRELRAKSLIRHNNETLDGSDIVYLTILGKNLVSEISKIK